jgi:hypothetical protein
VLSQLPGDFFKDTHNSENGSGNAPNRVALALALLGWQGLSNARIGQVPNSASCHTCLRRLGLWMFKSKEVDENGEVLVPAPMDYLDPLREHRFFCPWKNASTQRWATGRPVVVEESPGWAILLQTIQNNAHLRSVYEGRPRSRARSGASRPLTPAAPATPGRGNGDDTESERPLTGTTSIEDDDKERDAKDKERWARLKRVKSLFDIKGRKIRHSLSRPGSRPGTAHSARSGPTESAS